MQIGDKLWCHDSRSNSRPWFESEISGETRQSWLVGATYKVNKKTLLENMGPSWGERRWYTPEERALKIWLGRNASKIADHVSTCEDVETLVKIADLVGCFVEKLALPNGERQESDRG